MSAALEMQNVRFGPRWLAKPMVRTILAVVLTMGWYYCFYQLLSAAIVLSGMEREALDEKLYLLLAQQALQALAGMAGCLIVGAGNPHAALYGTLAGGINGVFFVVERSFHPALESTIINLYSQPVLHTAFGIFGSLLGAWLWPPMPALAPMGDSLMAESALELYQQRKLAGAKTYQAISWRIHWIRVLVGTIVAVIGVMSADQILRTVVFRLPPGDPTPFFGQQRLFTMEVAGLAVFAGAFLAGANTANGSLQGACVGLLSAFIIFGYQLGGGEPFRFSDIPPALQMAGSLILSSLGGWLAATIIPPIVVEHKTRIRGVHL